MGQKSEEAREKQKVNTVGRNSQADSSRKSSTSTSEKQDHAMKTAAAE